MYTALYIARFIESVGVQAMKRTEIKRRPLSDTVLANLEPESKEYRELDGDGLYFRVKPDGKKAWLFRYKKADGKWSWLGIGTYPELSGKGARKKASEIVQDISHGDNPIITKQERKRKELVWQVGRGEVMSEIIDFKSETQADSQPMTDDEMRLANIYDVAVGLIIDIEEGRIFSMAEIKAQMIEVLEIIQEEL